MKLCMGCMNQIDDRANVCPICGYAEQKARAEQESYYLKPGSVVGGKYIVGKVISYSGYTVSYMGFDAENNRKHVIKEYLPNEFSTRSDGENEITIYSGDAKEQFEHGLTNFLNEANKIQSLGNIPGVEKVYDCVLENDTGYVITEYLEGKTLKELMASGKTYSPQEAVKLLRQILQGLSKLHPMNVIHCDIAPETIKVLPNGTAKLMDFGSTRYVTTANSKSLAVILKQGFAPEEMYRSKGERGPWTDVYALGAVLYYMITGFVPQESIERTLADDLREPSKMGASSIPSNVENAILNALNVFKENRTPSAAAFLKELESPNVKRIKENKKKDGTKFPGWAKAMVACLFCLILVGGGLVFFQSSRARIGINVNNLQFPDLTGLSEEECDQKLKTWVESNKLKDTTIVNKDYVFNIEADGEKVTRQEPAQGTMIGKSMDDDGKVYVDESGNLNGFIKIYIESPTKFSYREFAGLNAYSLSVKMKADIEKDSRFSVNEGKQGNYYDILSIRMKDGSSKDMEEIKGLKDNAGFIDLNEIESIEYLAGDFFYWEEFPEYVGKLLVGEGDELAVGDTFRKSGEGSNAKQSSATDVPLAGNSFVDATYYSFEKKAGEIVEQNVEAGNPVDATKLDEEQCPEGILLLAIMPVSDEAPDGGSINAKDYKGEDLKAKLVSLGFSEDSISIPGEKDTKVTQVKVTKDDLDVQWFKVDEADSLKFEIITEKKAEPVKTPSSSSSQKKDNTPDVNVPIDTQTVPEQPSAPEPVQNPDADF